MKNMDFDKLVQEHLKTLIPDENRNYNQGFDLGFLAGAKWAKDLLSSKLKEDHISPEDRRMIYEMAWKIKIAYLKCGFENTIDECYETAKRLYLLIKQES